jgi:hypothetical protein
MFRYSPSLLIHAGDNLVLDSHDSLPTMNSDTGIGTREQILLAKIRRHCDSILPRLSTCSGGSKAVGSGARRAIEEPGGDGGACVLGAIAGDVLIASNGNTKGIDDDVLAKDGGRGDPLGSIDDNAVQLTVTSNSDSSTVRRELTSMCTVAAHRSHIRIGLGPVKSPGAGA